MSLLKSITLPPLQKIDASQLSNYLLPGDVVLTHQPLVAFGYAVSWGQTLMLRKFGYDADTIRNLTVFTHAVMCLSSPGIGIEAIWPKIACCDIAKKYAGTELLVLRPRPLTLTEMTQLEIKATGWLGVEYDWREYVIYPFYMYWGWAPGWWGAVWDDPKKPVCSGLCIRLYQDALGLMGDIRQDQVRTYPPARLATRPEFTPKHHLQLLPEFGTKNDSKTAVPWWVKKA